MYEMIDPTYWIICFSICSVFLLLDAQKYIQAPQSKSNMQQSLAVKQPGRSREELISISISLVMTVAIASIIYLPDILSNNESGISIGAAMADALFFIASCSIIYIFPIAAASVYGYVKWSMRGVHEPQRLPSAKLRLHISLTIMLLVIQFTLATLSVPLYGLLGGWIIGMFRRQTMSEIPYYAIKMYTSLVLSGLEGMVAQYLLFRFLTHILAFTSLLLRPLETRIAKRKANASGQGMV
jgi:hypothetical protein